MPVYGVEVFLAALILLLVLYIVHLKKKISRDQEILENTKERLSYFLEENIEVGALMQAVEDGVIVTSLNGKIKLASIKAASILKTEVATLLDKDVNNFLPLHDFKDQYNGELTKDINLPSGETISLLIKTSPIISDQTIKGRILTFHDKTDQKVFEEMKFDFVAMVAHQLRTPMTTLRGYMSVLAKTIPGKLLPEEKLYFERSLSGIEKLASLVEYLINVTKVGENRLTLNLKPTSLEKILQDVKASYEVLASRSNIQINLEKPQIAMPLVSLDPNLIETVLENFVANAIEHSNSKQIVISAKVYDKEVWVSVQDFGKGIPSDSLDHLFQKFYKVPSHLLATPGSGLGLYVSKQIIDAHKGRIWADSILGQGSTFSFSLPLPQKTS
jgi:signal transduction histidine kinase